MPDASDLPEGPLAAFRRRVAAGEVAGDPAQEAVAARLDRLHEELRGYRLEPAEAGRGLFRRLGLGRRAEPGPAPRGVYLWGGIGRGKSMLMDLFFAGAPVERKRRVHFNAFMLEIHARLHEWRQSVASEFDRKRGRHMADPIPPLARRVADEAWLLCFDELHVVDIADAMILGRLFAALFELGVVVVATSNWAPDELYAGGLQRDRFLPFIALLKQRLDVVELDAERDYRLARLIGREVYHWPLGAAAHRALEATFAELTDGAAGAPVTIAVPGGRTLEVPRAAAGVAWIGFDALCARPLGAADYLALAGAFHTVLVEGVPGFTERLLNEMKRFIVLIDCLYETHRAVVLSAEAPPDRLFAAESQGLEFERTVSRLMEMQSARWIAARRGVGSGADASTSSA